MNNTCISTIRRSTGFTIPLAAIVLLTKGRSHSIEDNYAPSLLVRFNNNLSTNTPTEKEGKDNSDRKEGDSKHQEELKTEELVQKGKGEGCSTGGQCSATDSSETDCSGTLAVDEDNPISSGTSDTEGTDSMEDRTNGTKLTRLHESTSQFGATSDTTDYPGQVNMHTRETQGVGIPGSSGLANTNLQLQALSTSEQLELLVQQHALEFQATQQMRFFGNLTVQALKLNYPYSDEESPEASESEGSESSVQQFCPQCESLDYTFPKQFDIEDSFMDIASSTMKVGKTLEPILEILQDMKELLDQPVIAISTEAEFESTATTISRTSSELSKLLTKLRDYYFFEGPVYIRANDHELEGLHDWLHIRTCTMPYLNHRIELLETIGRDEGVALKEIYSDERSKPQICDYLQDVWRSSMQKIVEACNVYSGYIRESCSEEKKSDLMITELLTLHHDFRTFVDTLNDSVRLAAKPIVNRYIASQKMGATSDNTDYRDKVDMVTRETRDVEIPGISGRANTNLELRGHSSERKVELPIEDTTEFLATRVQKHMLCEDMSSEGSEISVQQFCEQCESSDRTYPIQVDIGDSLMDNASSTMKVGKTFEPILEILQDMEELLDQPVIAINTEAEFESTATTISITSSKFSKLLTKLRDYDFFEVPVYIRANDHELEGLHDWLHNCTCTMPYLNHSIELLETIGRDEGVVLKEIYSDERSKQQICEHLQGEWHKSALKIVEACKLYFKYIRKACSEEKTSDLMKTELLPLHGCFKNFVVTLHYSLMDAAQPIVNGYIASQLMKTNKQLTES